MCREWTDLKLPSESRHAYTVVRFADQLHARCFQSCAIGVVPTHTMNVRVDKPVARQQHCAGRDGVKCCCEITSSHARQPLADTVYWSFLGSVVAVWSPALMAEVWRSASRTTGRARAHGRGLGDPACHGRRSCDAVPPDRAGGEGTLDGYVEAGLDALLVIWIVLDVDTDEILCIGRNAWPSVSILVRGDSGFCRLVGGPNVRPTPTEHLPAGANPRFVVTSLRLGHPGGATSRKGARAVARLRKLYWAPTVDPANRRPRPRHRAPTSAWRCPSWRPTRLCSSAFTPPGPA